MKSLFVFILLAGLVSCSSVSKKSSESISELVSFQSKLGKKIFSQAEYKNDFFELVNHFTPQPNKLLCGPTSMAIVLNTLKVEGAPKAFFHEKDLKYIPKSFDPRLSMFTPRNVIGSKTHEVKSSSYIFGKIKNSKRDIGLQLYQLKGMLRAYGLKAKQYTVNNEIDLDRVRQILVSALKSRDTYALVNYARRTLKQPGGGHISPISAYDQKTDSFLVMDVNPTKASWVWVPTILLYKAMKTYDTMENRGFVIIK